MKQLLLFTLLLAMITPSIVFCQEQQPRQPVQPQPMVQQPRPAAQAQAQNQMQQRGQELAMRERELSLQQKQNEINFQNEKHKIELEKLRQSIKPVAKKQNNNDKMAPLLLILLVVHILCAVWVYQDIRRLNAGSGIWIVIALLTGLLGTLVYAIVRIGGDIKIKS